MLTDSEDSFTDRLSSKLAAKQQLNIPPNLKRVAAPTCETFVLKNRHAPELSEANSRAKLSYTEQLLKNIYSLMLASFCASTKTFIVATLKNPQNDWLYAQPSTKKKDVATKRLRTQ